MNNRIKIVRKNAGLTLEKFGERLGITASSCSAIETGKNNPSEQTIRAICREFGIDEVWLRTGVGEMFRQQTREEEMVDLMGKLLADRPESFRRRLISALLRFDPNGKEWQVIEEIFDAVYNENKEEQA